MNYHELTNPHCPVLDLPSDANVTAILDGQQRLTALNIGLRGSHAEKLPRKWRNSPDAYPKKYLYLNLMSRAPESDLDFEYEFRFLTPEEANRRRRRGGGSPEPATLRAWGTSADAEQQQAEAHLTAAATKAGINPDAHRTWAAVAQALLEADPSLDLVAIEAWATAADGEASGVATQLATIAEDAGIDPDDYSTWAAVAEAIIESDQFHWFRASDVLEMESGPGIFRYVQDNGLTETEAFFILNKLHEVVHKEPTINYYEEDGADLDRVLNMFIRVNSAGTVLSYSDLLLSIATAQWRQIDARDAIYGLVDEINRIGYGFDFTKDIVLKAGLVLTDVNDIRFKVTNFNRSNMEKLEQSWESIGRSLRVGALLLAEFGFSERNLKAQSTLIPISYYVHLRQLGDDYLNGVANKKDRDAAKSWLVRSLLKAGVWGSGLDTLLTALRQTIKEHGTRSFPAMEIESAMGRRGKSLRFQEDEIVDLAETPYGDKNVFPLLSLLYPGVNVAREFHEDHIFPKKWLTAAKLRSAGVPDSELEEFRERSDGLPNLQLLEGPINSQKSEMLPAEWAVRHYPDEQSRQMYLSSHDMHDLPEKINQFPQFYDSRRNRIIVRLRRLLGLDEQEKA